MENKISLYVDKLVKEGTTITEIIKKSNVGRTSFYDIMNGKQVPKLDTANKIATALNVDIKELFPELKE
ncbi:XRE family transcriptional regulator [Clostridium botulinum]|nr:XRE family transcriptional regulator [Clostridium botulinum]NFA10624.1 XRE family transcriptional regulator [Clostridium botulinum]NFA26131.1 XRE family transcriptional regulator [Clostridium botulinum]